MPRRKTGDGRIYEREDGSWVTQSKLSTPTPKDQDTARQKLYKLLTESGESSPRTSPWVRPRIKREEVEEAGDPLLYRRPKNGPTSRCLSRIVHFVTNSTTLLLLAHDDTRGYGEGGWRVTRKGCRRTLCASMYILWRYVLIF